MSYQLNLGFPVGEAGLTLRGQLYDVTTTPGTLTAYGAEITTGVIDLGDGNYSYLATVPDDFDGVMQVYEVGEAASPLATALVASAEWVAALQAGDGSISVDHDYGGDDALAYIIDGGHPVDNARIHAFLKTDYDAEHRTSAYVVAEARTDANGRWLAPMRLDPGEYTLVFFKQGEYGPDTQEITVT